MNWLQPPRPAGADPRTEPAAADRRRHADLRLADRRTIIPRAPSIASPPAWRSSPWSAVGQTLVVLTRNIDLSVGSICRLHRLFRRHADRQSQRDQPAARRGDLDRAGRGAGRRQRRDRRLGPRARGGRHAGDARDLSRRAGRSVGRQDGDDRQPAAMAGRSAAAQRRSDRRSRHPRPVRASPSSSSSYSSSARAISVSPGGSMRSARIPRPRN